MTVELGQGFLTFLGTLVSGVIGIIVLVLNQRSEFKKAALSRDQARQDADARLIAVRNEADQKTLDVARQLAADTTAKTLEIARQLAETSAAKTMQVARDLAATATDTAARLADQLKVDADRKEGKLNEIHEMVDGRLTKALNEIAELKTIIAGLIAANKATAVDPVLVVGATTVPKK